MLDEGSPDAARVLSFSGGTLGSFADVEPDRKRVFGGSSRDGADEGITFVGNRQTDGVQADHGGVENLAAIERRKTIAESHRRYQI